MDSAGLVVLVPKMVTFLSGDIAKLPKNYKLQLLSAQLGLFVARDQQARKVTILSRVTEPHQQDEVGLLLHNGSRHKFVWNSGEPVGCLLVCLCLIDTDVIM